MKRVLLALMAAALIGSSAPARADAPKATVRGPSTVSAGATIVLDARASVADRPLKWKLDGPDVPFLVLDQDGHKGVVALVPSAQPGVYKFTLIAKGIPQGEVEVDADAAMWTVSVEAPAPTPPPTPAPTPTPSPTPPPAPTPTPTPAAGGHLFVTLVVDLDAMTQAVATLREGVSVRPALSGMNAQYRTVGLGTAEFSAIRLGPYVTKAGGAPCLVIQDKTGAVLSAVPAPATEADLIAAVKRQRGGL